jgi:hypothetical protein
MTAPARRQRSGICSALLICGFIVIQSPLWKPSRGHNPLRPLALLTQSAFQGKR